MRARCDEDAALGVMSEREPEKNTRATVTQKTWKQREKENWESVGSSCIWMKTHFRERFSDADRPNEESARLVWLHALTAKLSRHRPHTFCKEHAPVPFFFYSASCSPSLYFSLWSQNLWSSTRLRERALEKHSLFLHSNKADISHTFIIQIS